MDAAKINATTGAIRDDTKNMVKCATNRYDMPMNCREFSVMLCGILTISSGQTRSVVIELKAMAIFKIIIPVHFLFCLALSLFHYYRYVVGSINEDLTRFG